MKKYTFISILIACAMFLSACSDDVQIFKHKEDNVGLKPVNASDLEKDKYYVKNGTRFFLTMKPNASASDFSSAVDESRVICITKEDEETIPTYYKDELIAYTSAKEMLKSITLERFRDLGFSFGVYNATFNKEQGTLDFESNRNVFKNTSAYEAFSDLESKNIRISAIDGKSITKEDVDLVAGVFPNLEKDKEYKVSFYAGTYYHETLIKADTQILKSYEIYNYDETYISDTQNGYMAFYVPDDLKSGYYLIEGKGLYKYYDHKRGENDNVDMNLSYYETEEDRIAAYSRQYSVNLDAPTRNMSIVASYNSNQDRNDAAVIKGYVYSPDGTQYIMDLNDETCTLSLDLAEAMAGLWTINIVPITLDINSIDVTDNTMTQQLTQEEFEVVLDEPRQNIAFKTYYTNDVNEKPEDIEINGSIVTESGETFPLESTKEEDEITGEKKLLLKYQMIYAPAGTYKIYVNHYPTKTTVQEPIITNNTQTGMEVIVVEE